jgi:hypothetical protein
MRLKAEWDNKNVLLRLRNGQKRMAYAVVNALNKTARDIQQAEFANVRRKFSVRVPNFFFGTEARPGGVAAKVTFANVRRGVFAAEVATGKAALGGKRRVILPQFEEGGTVGPTQGRGLKAVPLTGPGRARPEMAAKIDKKFTFSAMNLAAFVRGKKVKRPGRRRSTERGFGTSGSPVPTFALEGAQWKGRNNTFMVKHTRKLEHGGVFQRIGSGRGDVRMIWKFQPNVRIDKRLGFFSEARLTWHRMYEANFRAEVRKVLERHG